MTWYKFKQIEDLEITPFEILELIVDMFNLGGFRFKPTRTSPEIQEFIDKHPDMIEPIDEKENSIFS